MPTGRRTVILVALLVAAGSLAFATGAAVIDGPADTVADGDLAIQPVDGSNGQYTYLNDDKVAIDVSSSNPNINDPSFEGVNVGTAGRIDDVFTVTYTGEQFARVWIGHPNESVTFVADGDSIEGEANNVTLAPNESVSVGLAFGTRDATAGTRLGADEFSIEAEIAEPEETTAAGVNFDAVTQIESHENPGDNYGFKIVNQGTRSVMLKMSYYSIDPGWLDGGGYDRTDPPV